MLVGNGGGLRGGVPARLAAEGSLSRLWYGDVFARRGLRTRCGRLVRVLYRGLPNGGRGPDYQGAVLSLGRGRPRAGDIELHVRTSQWRAHGHHLDAHYDGVILHVVWEDDDPRPTLLASGRQVPVLAVGSLPAGAGGSRMEEPCREVSNRSLNRLGEALDRAGEERFLEKAARLEGDLAVFHPQEVLYQAMAGALGYARNQGPFRRLAALLPLGVLEGYLWGKDVEVQKALAQALLLGAAGLLPSQRGLEGRGGWPGCLEELWRASGLERQIGPGEWSLAVRPENHPARRLAGLASIIVESLREGLVEWAVSGFRVQGPRSSEGQGFRVEGRGVTPKRERWSPNHEAWALDPRPCTLDAVARLRREARGYWLDNYDFGLAGRRRRPSLVGRGRALEVAANALLPFVYAYGQATGGWEMSHAALGAYHVLPSPGPNCITRHMARQLLGAPRPALARTARRQQGLLHLFRSYCTMGRCPVCPLAGS